MGGVGVARYKYQIYSYLLQMGPAINEKVITPPLPLSSPLLTRSLSLTLSPASRGFANLEVLCEVLFYDKLILR